MSRFDYVRYDENASLLQKNFKEQFIELEKCITSTGVNAEIRSKEEDFRNLSSMQRSKALALDALEECYMWIGKLIRDEQLVRTHGQLELQEQRKDG